MKSASRVAARHFDLLGLTLTVACDDPALQAQVDALLDGFASAPRDTAELCAYAISRDGHGDYVLSLDGEVLARDSSGAAAIGALLVDLNRRAVDTFTGFAVHAGVVAGPDGSVIVFPGVSGAGKSTLTAACTGAGFAYVSDEALCVDPVDGRVVAYPKPIALARDAWTMVGRTAEADLGVDDGEKVLLSAAQLGAPVARGDLRVGHVVELARGAATARLVPSSRADGLAALLRRSFNHYKQPDVAFDLVSRLAAGFHAWRLEYSDPQSAAQLLAYQLAS